MIVCDECKGPVEGPGFTQGPILVRVRKPMSESKLTLEFCSRTCVARWAVPPPTIEEQAESMVAAFSSAPEWESIDIITDYPRREEKWELVRAGEGRVLFALVFAIVASGAVGATAAALWMWVR